MKKFAFALCATLFFAASCYAQAPDAAAPPADQGAAPAPAASGSGKGGGGKGGGKKKEIIEACRKEAKAKGMTPGHDMRQAVMDCVSKDHPGMANMLKCRMEGRDKGLKPGDELKSYVKDCMKKSG